MSKTRSNGSPYVVVSLALIIAIPLFNEFSSSENVGWTAFLAVVLTAIVVGSFFLARFFAANWDQIGEARFDTTNRDDR